MVVQAYILIQTEVGKAASVARAITDIKGVTQAEDVTGPYDVIVRAEARNVDELGKLVVAQVQGVPGITRTLTCPVVHLREPRFGPGAAGWSSCQRSQRSQSLSPAAAAASRTRSASHRRHPRPPPSRPAPGWSRSFPTASTRPDGGRPGRPAR